jgi:hypothetical protein
MHSYTTPAILVIPLESRGPPYLGWLMAETEPAAGLSLGRARARSAIPRTL